MHSNRSTVPVRILVSVLLALMAGAFALLVMPASVAQAAEAEAPGSSSDASSASLAASSFETATADSVSAAAIAAPTTSIYYRTHAREGAWQPKVKDGMESGMVEGAIDAVKIKVKSSLEGSVQYQVYVNGVGWRAVSESWKRSGLLGGKYGIKAVRIALTGEISSRYDVVYSVRAQGGDWQSQVKNGAVAGSYKSGTPLSAIKISLVEKKAASAQGNGIVGVRYKACLKNRTWQVWQANNATAGKTMQSSRLRGLAVSLDSGVYEGGIRYRVRTTNGKWKAYKENGATTGVFTGIEAVRVKLTGDIAKKYDVVYSVNIDGYGWLNRVRNGKTAGIEGQGKNIRAIRIQLVEKSKRSGWVKVGANWRYFKNGTPVRSHWIVTKESPINGLQGTAQGHGRYWLDASGTLAVDRFVDPKSELDAGAGYLAYATGYGYVVVNEKRLIGNTWYEADEMGALTKVKAPRADVIDKYISWAIDIANDNSHGYSQYNRWGPDYDCSSLVVAAIKSTGIDVGSASWTGNMKSELTKHGFRWYTNLKKIKRGDVLLAHNDSHQHTEIYLGNGQTVGAHISETGGIHGLTGDQTGHEIDVGPYYDMWDGFLRYVG